MTSVMTFLAGFGVGTVLFPFGFWFWLFMLADFMWLSYLVSDGATLYDEPNTDLATVLLLGTSIFLQLFTHIKVFSWIFANGGLAALIFGAYVLIGVVWSFIKWTTLLVDWRDSCQDNLKQTNKIIADAKTPDEAKRAKESLLEKLPTASKNKSRIIAWAAYWPWSLMWTFITDYVRRFFQRIFQVLEGYYDAVQKRILKDFYKE